MPLFIANLRTHRFDHHLELANKSCMASKTNTNEISNEVGLCGLTMGPEYS